MVGSTLEVYSRKYSSHWHCLNHAVCVVQRALVDVSDDDWNNIPDVGDARNKKQRNSHIRPDRYTPIPDSVLNSTLSQGGKHSSLNPRQQVTSRPATYIHEQHLPGTMCVCRL